MYRSPDRIVTVSHVELVLGHRRRVRIRVRRIRAILAIRLEGEGFQTGSVSVVEIRAENPDRVVRINGVQDHGEVGGHRIGGTLIDSPEFGGRHADLPGDHLQSRGARAAHVEVLGDHPRIQLETCAEDFARGFGRDRALGRLERHREQDGQNRARRLGDIDRVLRDSAGLGIDLGFPDIDGRAVGTQQASGQLAGGGVEILGVGVGRRGGGRIMNDVVGVEPRRATGSKHGLVQVGGPDAAARSRGLEDGGQSGGVRRNCRRELLEQRWEVARTGHVQDLAAGGNDVLAQHGRRRPCWGGSGRRRRRVDKRSVGHEVVAGV